MGNNFTNTLKTDMSQADVIGIVKRVVSKLGTKISDERSYGGGYIIETKEKLKLLSTNWPVKITVDIEELNGSQMINVKGECAGVSITQDGYTKAKTDEFSDMLSKYIDR